MSQDNQSLYEQMGKEPGLRRLVDRFYDLMNEKPHTQELRKMHPEDLTESREKTYLFLLGWSGGPQTYMELYGHPRLRARHLPFKIGIRERDQWLECFEEALSESPAPALAKQVMLGAIRRLADHMRNQDEIPG